MNRAISAPPVSEINEGLAVLNSLPHPVVMVDADRTICYANLAAEAFFRSSRSFLTRHEIDHFVPFGSPVLTLVDQVRHEYRRSTNTRWTYPRRALAGTRWWTSTPRRWQSGPGMSC